MGVKVSDRCSPFLVGAGILCGALLVNAETRPLSLACQTFRDQLLAPELRNEQFAVIKDGKAVFSWADGTVTKDTPRQMWSASKSITSTLMATAIQEGKIKLDDPIAPFFPEAMNDRKVDQQNFRKVKIRDLLQMTSGFEWRESARASIEEQSDLPFFYSKGYPNLARFILRTRFDAVPGKKWNYSSVNAILQMAILRKVYGDQASEMPWTNLFKPLGLKSARFEKDRSGTYVGAAYIHLSAQDLALIGLLFLNDGVWNGQRILPEHWVATMATALAPQSASSVKSREDFVDKGPYSKGGFWLNKAVPGVGRPFPHLPETMYFASGLFGQVLFILPEQNMVIARTGFSDPGRLPPFDGMIGQALRCFGAEKKGIPRTPPNPSEESQEVFNPFAIFDQISGFSAMLKDGSFTGMVAKEMCSCHFVAKLPMETCIARSPVPSMMISLVAEVRTDEPSRSITLYPRLFTYPAQAVFNSRHPREGCKLTYGQAEYAAQAAAKSGHE